MGGETVISSSSCSTSSSEDMASPERFIAHVSRSDEVDFSVDSEIDSVINGLSFCDSPSRLSSVDKFAERQRSKVSSEIMRIYEELQFRTESLAQAKHKILSYTPGSWVEKMGSISFADYDLPEVTTLLLIGPHGSGKSTLVNNIYRAFEDNVPLSGRAHVSYNHSVGDGTCFLHEYLIPSGSGSFCLYDTRSLSINSPENQKMLESWMKKGVSHGELIERKSDSLTMKARLKHKARRCFSSNQIRAVDFVIFVVNGVSVLEAMESESKQYPQTIANYYNPLLSFKDDMPVVVITHGDLLSLSDRVRIRLYLGDLLGVSPTTQFFDIPDNREPTTTLTIYDMLTHCLYRADRNFPAKDWFPVKVFAIANLLFWILMTMMAIYALYTYPTWPSVTASQKEAVEPLEDLDWDTVRHLWSD